MKVIVKRVTTATSKKSGKEFQIVIAADEANNPVKFFASANEYKDGDKVELYVDTNFDFMARVAHKRV